MTQIELLEKRIDDNFELIIKAKKDIALCNKAIFKIRKNVNDQTNTQSGNERTEKDN